MKYHTVLLRLLHAKQLPASVNGNPRWLFNARPADDAMEEFKTASDVSSAYGCNLSRLKPGEVIRAKYHRTATGTLMVTAWDDGRSSGVDLSSQFDALEMQHQLRAELRDAPATPSPVRL
jgi:hypothetical protein